MTTVDKSLPVKPLDPDRGDHATIRRHPLSFSTKFGFPRLVREGRKTETRRVVKGEASEAVQAAIPSDSYLDRWSLATADVRAIVEAHARQTPGAVVKAYAGSWRARGGAHPFAELRIERVGLEQVNWITPDGAEREGLRSLAEFRHVWVDLHGDWDPTAWVWVIRFRLETDHGRAPFRSLAELLAAIGSRAAPRSPRVRTERARGAGVEVPMPGHRAQARSGADDPRRLGAALVAGRVEKDLGKLSPARWAAALAWANERVAPDAAVFREGRELALLVRDRALELGVL